jgi:hypothetical protein
VTARKVIERVYAGSMNAEPVRQQLHELVDELDEPQAERVLRLVRSELAASTKAAGRPWPDSIGAGHSGLGDLASNPERYFVEGFGR